MISATTIIGQMNEPTEADKALVQNAYDFAATAHEGHMRYSGEPYLTHTTAVAYKLAEMGMGPRTISAALLHDTIEDTTVTAEDIQSTFGDEVLFLVEGVTKLSSVRYYGSDRHNESLRKLFVATSQDIRVLIIKLMDRIHNMETLDHVPTEKRQRIARETLEIYAPVAHRLGMGRIRKELEDLAFPYVYPEDHERIKTLLESTLKKANENLERERKTLQKRLAEEGLIDFNTEHRVKGLYSLYHKLHRKQWNIEDVYDLLAMRITVPNVEDCYRVLGLVHELWRPLPQRVKDYIAFPKPNGYQSIHTTVATGNGTILEIQIRTRKMHHEAEFGVASHMMYKKPLTSDQPVGQGWFSNLIPNLFRPFRTTPDKVDEVTKESDHTAKIPKWISEIGELYTRDLTTGKEFVDDMRQDFFTHRIFVFTPNGDVVDLPVGATPIDFAYAIHSEIGDRISGAKVNNKLVQLDSTLKNGDMIQIETKKNAHPTAKWLDSAKTSLARRRIRAWLEQNKQQS